MNFTSNNKKKRQKLDSPARIEDAVGDRLRSFYAEIAQQEVPQHLLDLLDALDQADAQQAQPSVKK